jgi:hypothetical protein
MAAIYRSISILTSIDKAGTISTDVDIHRRCWKSEGDEMNEQGIAWMVAGGHHDDSPEEVRYRELRRALLAGRPPKPAFRERLAAVFAGRPTADRVEAFTVDCCAA